MAKKPIPRKRPDSPTDSPAHERGEGARERVKEYGKKSKSGKTR